MARTRAVFFDVDGVLLDSLPMHLQICEDLSREYGLGLTLPNPAEFKKLSRKGGPLSPMKSFFMTLGFGEQEAERATLYYRQHFHQRYSPAIFPTVDETLQRLNRAGLALGVATANVRVNVETALGHTWSLFDPRLQYTYDHVPTLTKAEALTAGYRKLGVAPEEVILVGDQLADRDAARQAGVPFLGVTYGWGISPEDQGFDKVHRPQDLAVYLLNGQEHS